MGILETQAHLTKVVVYMYLCFSSYSKSSILTGVQTDRALITDIDECASTESRLMQRCAAKASCQNSDGKCMSYGIAG